MPETKHGDHFFLPISPQNFDEFQANLKKWHIFDCFLVVFPLARIPQQKKVAKNGLWVYNAEIFLLAFYTYPQQGLTEQSKIQTLVKLLPG